MRSTTLLLPLLTAATLAAQTPAPDVSPATFHDDVLPLLTENCAGCHRPDKSEGDVVLTSHAAILAGASGIPLVVPDAPGDSLLLEVVCGVDGEAPSMPEDAEPLTDLQIELLRSWIAAGAREDGTPAPTAHAPEVYERPPVLTDLCWSDAGDGASWLAVPGRHEVLIWHRAADGTTRLRHRLPCAAARIESLAVAPDGQRLAACGGSPARFGELLVWDLGSGEQLLRSQVTDDSLFGISWSPDGKLIACGATDTVVRAFEAATGDQVLFQGAHDDWVLDTTWSTDGSHLVTVGRDRSMKLTKVATEQFIDNITSITPGAVTGGLIAVDRHPNRDELLVGGADGQPGIFRMYREKKRVIGDDFNRLHSLDTLPGRIVDLCWSADGSRAYALSSDGQHSRVAAWQIPAPPADEKAPRAAPTLLWQTDLARLCYGLAPSPDGDSLAAAGRGPHLTLIDIHHGTLLEDLVVLPLPTASESDAPVTPAHGGLVR